MVQLITWIHEHEHGDHKFSSGACWVTENIWALKDYFGTILPILDYEGKICIACLH